MPSSCDRRTAVTILNPRTTINCQTDDGRRRAVHALAARTPCVRSARHAADAVSALRTLSPELGLTCARRLNLCRARIGRRFEEQECAHAPRRVGRYDRPGQALIFAAYGAPCPQAPPPPWTLLPTTQLTMPRGLTPMALAQLVYIMAGIARHLRVLRDHLPTSSSSAASVGTILLALRGRR